MSITSYVQDDLRQATRQSWGRLFGNCIEKTREACGRSLQHNCILCPMPLASATTRSPCWLLSAREPGRFNPICRRPGPVRGTGGGYSNPYKLISREKGGETDQESRSVRSQKSEHQLGNQLAQRL
jgi:hypothetical protein